MTDENYTHLAALILTKAWSVKKKYWQTVVVVFFYSLQRKSPIAFRSSTRRLKVRLNGGWWVFLCIIANWRSQQQQQQRHLKKASKLWWRRFLRRAALRVACGALVMMHLQICKSVPKIRHTLRGQCGRLCYGTSLAKWCHAKGQKWKNMIIWAETCNSSLIPGCFPQRLQRYVIF